MPGSGDDRRPRADASRSGPCRTRRRTRTMGTAGTTLHRPISGPTSCATTTAGRDVRPDLHLDLPRDLRLQEGRLLQPGARLGQLPGDALDPARNRYLATAEPAKWDVARQTDGHFRQPSVAGGPIGGDPGGGADHRRPRVGIDRVAWTVNWQAREQRPRPHVSPSRRRADRDGRLRQRLSSSRSARPSRTPAGTRRPVTARASSRTRMCGSSAPSADSEISGPFAWSATAAGASGRTVASVAAPRQRHAGRLARTPRRPMAAPMTRSCPHRTVRSSSCWPPGSRTRPASRATTPDRAVARVAPVVTGARRRNTRTSSSPSPRRPGRPPGSGRRRDVRCGWGQPGPVQGRRDDRLDRLRRAVHLRLPRADGRPDPPDHGARRRCERRL
jgi:hypothetical protein